MVAESPIRPLAAASVRRDRVSLADRLSVISDAGPALSQMMAVHVEDSGALIRLPDRAAWQEWARDEVSALLPWLSGDFLQALAAGIAQGVEVLEVPACEVFDWNPSWSSLLAGSNERVVLPGVGVIDGAAADGKWRLSLDEVPQSTVVLGAAVSGWPRSVGRSALPAVLEALAWCAFNEERSMAIALRCN